MQTRTNKPNAKTFSPAELARLGKMTRQEIDVETGQNDCRSPPRGAASQDHAAARIVKPRCHSDTSVAAAGTGRTDRVGGD